MEESPTSELGAHDAQVQIARTRRRIRSGRWWYVASGLVMAVTLTAYYIAIAAWPEVVGDYVLPGALVVVAVLGLIAWRMRSIPRGVAPVLNRVILASFVLATVTLIVNNLLLPPGPSVWIVLTGLLPALPFFYLAWRVGRR